MSIGESLTSAAPEHPPLPSGLTPLELADPTEVGPYPLVGRICAGGMAAMGPGTSAVASHQGELYVYAPREEDPGLWSNSPQRLVVDSSMVDLSAGQAGRESAGRCGSTSRRSSPWKRAPRCRHGSRGPMSGIWQYDDSMACGVFWNDATGAGALTQATYTYSPCQEAMVLSLGDETATYKESEVDFGPVTLIDFHERT